MMLFLTHGIIACCRNTVNDAAWAQLTSLDENLHGDGCLCSNEQGVRKYDELAGGIYGTGLSKSGLMRDAWTGVVRKRKNGSHRRRWAGLL